jgi:hypothetical protein
MQLARENSIPKFCRFYPSHTQSTDLVTNHYRIGVHWHPYESKNARSIRDPQNFPLHWQASTQSDPPNFALHMAKVTRTGRLRVDLHRQLSEDELKYTLPHLIERTRFDEFSDYEMAYGNNNVPRWNIRAYEPSGLSWLPAVKSARASATMNPAAYVRDVIDGFARFHNPADLWAREDWLEFLDLQQSQLGSQFSSGFGPDEDDSLLGSLLAAQARKFPLEAKNLAASMRVIAETVVAYRVLQVQTPQLLALGITQAKIDADQKELGDIVGAMLDARKKYIETGDIDVEDEPFAAFDSKQDLDTNVNQIPQQYKVEFQPSDLTTISAMLRKLKPVQQNVKLDGNEVNQLQAELLALDALRRPFTPQEKQRKAFIVARLWVLRDSGVQAVVNISTTIISDAEKSKTQIVTLQNEVKASSAKAEKAVTDAQNALDTAAEKVRKANTTEGITQATKEKVAAKKATAEQNLTVAQAQLATVEADNAKKNAAIKKQSDETRAKLKTLAADLNTSVSDAKIPELARRKLTPTTRQSAVYQRAVSIATIDLMEKELTKMRFMPSDAKMKALNVKDREIMLNRANERNEQVRDAINTIENVRMQLRASDLVDKLEPIAGRGTLPFALAADKESELLTQNEATQEFVASEDFDRQLSRIFAL